MNKMGDKKGFIIIFEGTLFISKIFHKKDTRLKVTYLFTKV